MNLHPAPLSAFATTAPTAHLPLASIRPTPNRLSRWDYAGMLAGFLLTLAITVVNSHGRIFWEDEMLGWLLLRDPSWTHMVRAWNLGADGGGFSFYLLGRAWFHLFGDSALAFRLFSSTCFGLAFVATWAALRRFYPFWIVAFATANTIFFSPPLTMHFLEGRFYGLLVMSTAFALWLTLALDAAPNPVTAPTPKRLYLAAFLIHGLLTTSHLLGGVYSFFILGALIALDRLRGRRRFGLYLTVAASWLLLLPELTSIRAAGRVGKPHFWTVPPTPAVVLGAYTGFSPEIRLVLAVLVCGAALNLVSHPGGFRRSLRANFTQRSPVYVLTLCILLVPVWFLLEGLVGTWLFTDRYLQPVTLGLAYLTAELFFLAASHPLLARAQTRFRRLSLAALPVAGVLFTAFTLVWVFHHIKDYTQEAPDFTEALTARLPHNLPVVVEDGFTFTGLIGRQADSGVHYTYLLDWPFTISPDAPWLEVVQYHLMENWKLAGYFPDHIEDIDTFLRQHPRFLVVHSGPIQPSLKPQKPEIGNIIAERLAANPAYQVRPYLILDRTFHDSVRDTVWEVCHGSCSHQPPLPPQPSHCVLWSGGTTCCSDPACNLPTEMAPHSLLPWHWKRANTNSR